MPSKKTPKSTQKKSKKLSPTEKLKNTISELEISLNETSEKHLRLKAEFCLLYTSPSPRDRG